MNLPKLSYVLLSHNREKYIRGAIESAFAQDYEGELEYIISDDCSTDRTFEIIKECVAAYKGSRRVVVTQTPHNMHLAGNTNHALQFVTGEFVIRADDDDYSTIDRCSHIGRAIATHPGCSYVFADFANFTDNDDDDIVKCCSFQRAQKGNYRIYAFSEFLESLKHFQSANCLHQAWSVDVYRKFGAIPLGGYYVDDVISHYRALLLGVGVYIPATLAYIRKASLNMSSGGDDGKRGFSAIMRLEKFNDKYMNVTYAPLEQTIAELEAFMSQNRPEALSKAAPFFETLHEDMRKRAQWRTYWRKGTLNRLKIRREMKCKGLFSLLRCLPMPIFAALLSVYRYCVKDASG